MLRPFLALGLAGLALSACTTGPGLPPVQAVRYHQGDVARGTVAVEAAPGTPADSIEFAAYLDAVRGALLRSGYAAPVPGARAQFVASVDVRRRVELGPPRRSPISIGIGGGGFSGGRGGGVGLGGGVGFPIGGGGRREVSITEMSVAIRGADQVRVWEGSARGVAELRGPDGSVQAQAGRLANALFTGFPGESGRTIDVR